jgi:hypothetical protein
MLERPTQFKMGFSTLAVALVFAVVASAAFAGAASATTQHWYVGGVKMKARTEVTGVAKDFTYGRNLGAIQEVFQCGETKIRGTIDPAGSISTMFALSNCVKVGYPNCEVHGYTPTISGSIGESPLGTAISYGARRTQFFRSDSRGECGGEAFTTPLVMDGTAVSLSVPNAPGEYEFSKNSGSVLESGPVVWFTGRYSLSAGGKPVTIAP